ncbi:MAG: hypothetical protein RID91_17840 [Azospirillaceae bacterium]
MKAGGPEASPIARLASQYTQKAETILARRGIETGAGQGASGKTAGTLAAIDAALPVDFNLSTAGQYIRDSGMLGEKPPMDTMWTKPDGGVTNMEGGGLARRRLHEMFTLAMARGLNRVLNREAEQSAFEAEHGFRPRNTEALRNVYNEARAGTLSIPSFSSREDAMDFALRMAGDLQSATRSVATGARHNDPETLQPMIEALGAEPAKIIRAQSKDRAEAGRMEAFIADTLLRGALDVSGPTHTLDGADSRVEAVTLSWQGEKLLTLDPDQDSYTYFDSAGNALDARAWQDTRVDIRA